MNYAEFSIQEFLGIILIGFPVLIWLTLILIEFLGRLRNFFYLPERRFRHRE